ncbi:MAG: Ger(x)C family spore germination protein [Candidatus Pelethousia sp.]|nr:Ger(x)C family spore germination protein [Candidatus Pelethousia sp.]
MIAPGKRMAALALALAGVAASLTGCWDNREIDRLSIITGIAVDISEEPNMIDVTLEVANTQGDSTDSGNGESGQSAFTMQQATGETVKSAIMQIDLNTNHKSTARHNRIRLFSTELAEQGLKRHIDMIMRESQTRLEVPILLVDGSAGDLLSAKVSEEELCGIFLSGLVDDLAEVSVEYRIRLIDFMKKVLEETTSVVIPIIKMFKEGEKKEIKIVGMAVFKDDRMIGRLSNDAGLGYIWSLQNVKKSDVTVAQGADHAVLHIANMSNKRKVTIREDGGVRVHLSVACDFNITELAGFGYTAPNDLVSCLEELVQEKIKKTITDTFKSAQDLGADIYGFGAALYQKHPKEWRAMKPNWDALFKDIDFSVEVDAHLAQTGQIVQSLEMEERMHEN